MEPLRKTTGGRRFVICPYLPSTEGVYRPSEPPGCPSSDSSPCKLTLHSRRTRKAGPPIPLAIFQCATHQIYFTIYPPGWAPWLRLPLAPYSPEGQPVADGDDIFTGSRDAAKGFDWPLVGILRKGTKEVTPLGVSRTQKRQVHLAARLLGIHPGFDDFTNYAISLQLPELELREACTRIRDGPTTFRKIAQEVVATHTKLQALTYKLTKLLRTGSQTQMWGVPITNFEAPQ